MVFAGRRIRRIARRTARRTARRILLGGFTILLLGGVAYKMRTEDLKRIETENKKKAEDLTEEDLLQAMKKLGIEKLELTAEERKQAGTV